MCIKIIIKKLKDRLISLYIEYCKGSSFDVDGSRVVVSVIDALNEHYHNFS